MIKTTMLSTGWNNLNTYHVKVQWNEKNKEHSVKNDLNTYHVKVQSLYFL